jgi:hypothetical protein
MATTVTTATTATTSPSTEATWLRVRDELLNHFNADSVKKKLTPEILNHKGGERQGSLLHCASFNGTGKAVELLVVCGAKIEATDMYGGTPLIEAARGGNVETMEVLLKKGAKIEAVDSAGTALWMAAYRGHLPCVKLLVKYGANTKVIGKWKSGHKDCTPEQIASYKGYEDIMDFLQRASKNEKPLASTPDSRPFDGKSNGIAQTNGSSNGKSAKSVWNSFSSIGVIGDSLRSSNGANGYNGFNMSDLHMGLPNSDALQDLLNGDKNDDDITVAIRKLLDQQVDQLKLDNSKLRTDNDRLVKERELYGQECGRLQQECDMMKQQLDFYKKMLAKMCGEDLHGVEWVELRGLEKQLEHGWRKVRELVERESEDLILCGMCLKSKKNNMCVPCGHMMCDGCLSSVKDSFCPFCRYGIQSVQKMFY